MKLANRMIVAVLLLGMVLSLWGCITRRYDFEDLAVEDVAAITFHDISGAEVWDSEAVLAAEPFYTVEPDEHEAFVEAMRELQFSDTILLLPVAMDPSFSYAEYVVRVTMQDGSFRLYSCGGYNEAFDAQGEGVGSDHYHCDDEAWLNLLYSYCGERACRIYYHGVQFIMTVGDSAEVDEILSSAVRLEEAGDYRFSSDDFIRWHGQDWYLAEDGEPVLRMEGTYYRLTTEARDELARLMRGRISFWRYQEDPIYESATETE